MAKKLSENKQLVRSVIASLYEIDSCTKLFRPLMELKAMEILNTIDLHLWINEQDKPKGEPCGNINNCTV